MDYRSGEGGEDGMVWIGWCGQMISGVPIVY